MNRVTTSLLTVCGLALSCASAPSAHDGPAVLRDTAHSVEVTSFEIARVASPGDAPLETVLPSLQFAPTNGKVPNYGYTRDRLYARLRLKNETTNATWVLRLGNPHLRNIQLFVHSAGRYREIGSGGTKQPANQRALVHRDFCFPITFDHGDTLELIVATDTGQWLSIIPEVATREVMLRNRNRELAAGLFGLGGVIFVLLYNLFLLTVTRDRTYLYYVLASVSTHLIAVPGATGVLQYFFPSTPILEESLWHSSAVGWMGFTALFTRALLVKEKKHVGERLALTYASRLGFGLAFIPLLFGPHDTVATLFNVLTGLGQILIFCVACRAAFTWTDPVAVVFVAAWGAPILAGAAFIVGSHGLYPVSDEILYVLSGSSVWEVVVMSLALGYRINLLQKDKDVAAFKLKEANTELTRQISERSVQVFSALRLVDEPMRWNQALEPGTEINGRYRVEKKVGEGAMGAVYVVRRLHDDTRWAMKLATETRRETLARFAREAHIASLIRHENVVHIVDLDISAAGFMFIVLELVEGLNLRDWITQNAPAPPSKAAPILLQVASGLRALHAKGIAHRDLKPANVLLGTRPDGSMVAKIADFGVSNTGTEQAWAMVPTPVPEAPGHGEEEQTIELNSRRDAPPPPPPPAPYASRESNITQRDVSTTNLDLTRAGHVTGTPRYVAPELVHLLSKDYVRADIYAFGVMAYRVLASQYPFSMLPYELSREELMKLKPMPLPPAQAALESLVFRCLSFDHLSRPTADEVAAELETYLASHEKTAT